jgi:hypothetical protein
MYAEIIIVPRSELYFPGAFDRQSPGSVQLDLIHPVCAFGQMLPAQQKHRFEKTGFNFFQQSF